MSYRITLGFESEWADLCYPRDTEDLDELAAIAYAEDAKVITRDRLFLEQFLLHGLSFLGVDLTRLCRDDPE